MRHNNDHTSSPMFVSKQGFDRLAESYIHERLMNRNISSSYLFVLAQGCLEGQLRAANQQKHRAALDLEAEKCCVAEMRLMLDEAERNRARSQEVAAAQVEEKEGQIAAMAEQLVQQRAAEAAADGKLHTMKRRLAEVALQSWMVRLLLVSFIARRPYTAHNTSSKCSTPGCRHGGSCNQPAVGCTAWWYH
eukprot:jgi/Chrzof1/1000/Cz01g36110.t1